MKKYLMTGVAALAICAAFTSCSSKEELYNPEAISGMNKEKVIENYNARFLAYVGGSIAPDQDWGFGSGTRDGEYANGNMWAAKDDGKYLVPDPLSEGQKARVQYFYQMNQKNAQNEDKGKIDFFMQQVYTGGSDPTGVSSEKYRTADNQLKLAGNPNLAPDLVGGTHMDHLTAGSSDAHVNNFNGGSCGTYPNILNNDPQVLSDYPNATEGGYLANQNSLYHHSDEIELMKETKTDCFGYANSDWSGVRKDRYWQVSAETIDNYITEHQSDYNTWLAAKIDRVGHNIKDEVVNDFWGQLGRGFIGFDYELAFKVNIYASKTWDGDHITLRTGDAEKGNQFHKAFKGGKLVDYNDFDVDYLYNNEVVSYLSDQTNFYTGEARKLTFDDLYVKYDENGVKTTNEGNIWYAINLDVIDGLLAQDFLPVKGKKLEEWVKVCSCADGYYSDWIVSFMPALHYSNDVPPTPPTRTYTLRVLAEDLTFANSVSGVEITESDAGADFDFNDVVFDVAHVTGGTSDENGTWIRLMAAGGTLPLYIGSVAQENEVHYMFGVSETTMVNTYHGRHSEKTPVEFKYSSSQVNAKEIAIIVIKDNIQFTLSAQRGEPASKIAVDLTAKPNFEWADERQSLKEKYPLFVDWAQSGQKISEWWD